MKVLSAGLPDGVGGFYYSIIGKFLESAGVYVI
jgi:hypothetical protein